MKFPDRRASAGLMAIWSAGYGKYPSFCLFVNHFLFYAFFSVALLIQHTRLILGNLTTNEMINGWRYSYMKSRVTGKWYNPHDKGAFQNCLEFLGMVSRKDMRGISD